MKAALDRFIIKACQATRIPCSNFSVLPVLHVERLYDDKAFRDVREFCSDYLATTGCRALATVITPIAPILVEELKQAGFACDDYEERIHQLASLADIGLHGHYLRSASIADGPVHNYWNEHAVAEAQMAKEVEWLESRGLMSRRTYSAGWWYLDDGIHGLLARNGFEFDFSASLNRFNLSTWMLQRRGRKADVAGVRSPRTVLALAGICAAGSCSSVPRHLLRRHALDWLLRRKAFVSLYSHDWDMNPAAARTTLRDLAALGVRFSDLSSLAGQAKQ